MNQDILAENWEEMREEVRKTWDRLTDEDLETIRGDYESLISFLQDRYDYTRQQAIHEVDRFLEMIGRQVERFHL